MRRFRYIAVAGFATALLAGCGGPPRPSIELRWPPAPSEPKIAWVESIYSSHNLPRGVFGKIKDFLFGASQQRFVGKPYGVAFDGRSRLYIVDTANKGILVLDLRSGRAEFFNSMGSTGELVEPVYVVLDRARNVYVSDTELKRVVVFTPEHRFSHFIGSKDDFHGPVGMAFDQSGSSLYVVDTKLHKVKVFSPEGDFLREFGERGDERGEFHYPLTVAVYGDTIYVVDAFHFAVQAFDSTGRYLFSFGPTSRGMGSLARPRDIAIGTDDNLYITDAMRNNVQIFNRQGELLFTFGGQGTAAGQFRLPAGICITDDNTIYLADSMNGRIEVYEVLAQR
jgi:DNA-binding beta-propeller fold protein YncE